MGLTAHNSYGLGLVSRVTPNGSYFYDFDALGSTAGLGNVSGSYTNSYSYLPFGGILTSSESVTNPFQFVGQFGVTTYQSQLSLMGARFYDQNTGRFRTVDPLRLLSQTLYTYATNRPVSLIDPTGRDFREFRDNFARPNDFDTNNPEAASNNFVNQGQRLGNAAPDFDKQLLDFATNLWTGGPPNGFSEVVHLLRDVLELILPGLPLVNPQNTSVSTSVEPNDKTGAIGFGPQNFINDSSAIPYRIDFENVGPGSLDANGKPFTTYATAPAQRVTISDQLSSSLDWTTFRLGQLGFGDTVIQLPADAQNYSGEVTVTIGGSTVDVQLEAGIDLASGLVTATFQSIDPATSLPPSVLIGFLPPEDGTGAGKGYFSYTVRPKPGLPTGTQIRNVALISFDGQPQIATDQVNDQDPTAGTDPSKEALATIDSAPPTSSVAALPPATPFSTFVVSWSGQDDSGGSGIASYNVYVSIDGAPFTLWRGNTAQTSAAYAGQEGHNYSFYSVATDNVGNVQSAPMAAQATTKVALIPGDANGDGKVDFADFVVAARDYGKTNALWSDGDFNGDGSVGFDDLVIVARNYGRSVGVPAPSPAAGTAAIPPVFSDEPVKLKRSQVRRTHLSSPPVAADWARAAVSNATL